MPRLIIGDNVSLSEYVHIGCVNRIEIGDNVLMGSKIYITDHNHGVPPKSIAVGSPARVVKQWNEEKKIWVKVAQR